VHAGRTRRENGYYCPEQVAQERTILGPAQRDGLLEGLAAQTSGWNVLANQVGFAPQDDAPRRFVTTHGGDTNNPQILMYDYNRGYVRVQLTSKFWRSDFRVVDSVRQPEAAARTLESWMVDNGQPGAFLPSGEPSAAV